MVWRVFAFAKLEQMMVRRLLDSPLFHRGVGKIHDKVQRIRHGAPSEDLRVANKDNDNGRTVFSWRTSRDLERIANSSSPKAMGSASSSSISRKKSETK
ncbi:hypothetical protein BDW42DRAFT_117729 [Aspergillus taichungensis]|uniref:Uncharacterized protein n=1 Tax=Aspergillus taichungensis TaxID=482145 RepID=A0A2J5HRU5_9EURO|nr:hypothetical protein BDW42DRAFT_117729 [Aspergillus taichungensis]